MQAAGFFIIDAASEEASVLLVSGLTLAHVALRETHKCCSEEPDDTLQLGCEHFVAKSPW